MRTKQNPARESTLHTIPATAEVLTVAPVYEAPAAAVDIKLDQRAMVSIVVQRASESWEQEQAAAAAEAGRIQREIHTLEAHLVSLVDSIDTRAFRDKGENAIAALAGLGILGSLKFTIGTLDRETTTIPVEGKIEVKKGGYGSLDFEETVSASAPMRETIGRITDLQVEKAAYVEVASTARRNLADIPKLERWAEAQIAELVLSRSAGGQDWLDSLDAKLQRRVDLSGLKRQLKLIG